MTTFVQKLVSYVRAKYPAIAILTTEEQGAISSILDAAAQVAQIRAGRKFRIVTWSATEGMRVISPDPKEIADTQELLPALSQRFDDTIHIFRDLHHWPLDEKGGRIDPIMARALRDFISSGPERGSMTFIVGPRFVPFSTIEKLVQVMEYDLPSEDELKRIASSIAGQVNKPDLVIDTDLVKSLSGLASAEAENALALSLVETGKFTPSTIYREKTKAVKKSGLLEIIDPEPRGLDAIGGLENLKEWIVRRRKVFTEEAVAYGLPNSKGILLVGIPGTGKSLAAKCIGTALGVPTVRLDIGSLFNSLVGESEARTREALALADAVAPCVLFCDEIEKGLAGSSGSGSNDSGVTKRVFGSIIQWMQDHKKPVFLVATANDITALPPEFIRRGRFDEIFAVDLPTPAEREKIAAIHIAKRGRDPEKFDLKLVAKSTNEFTGSEIEAALSESMFAAFEDSREFTSEDIVRAAIQIIPLAKMAKEKIDALRAWAKSRARPAGKEEVKAQQPLASRKIDMSE